MPDITLYLDEDVRILLAEVLRNRGYTVSHVLEVGRNGKSDSEQLAYAIKHKMAILKIRELFTLSDEGALKEIKKLLSFEVIRMEGRGRNIRYILA